MSLLAARLGFALLLSSPFAVWGQTKVVRLGLQAPQLYRQSPTRTDSAFRQLQPSIVTLLDSGKACGYAAMIDASGLYIAHHSTIAGNEVEGRFWNGTLAHLHVIGQDGCTQLVLLRSDYIPVDAHPVSAPAKDVDPGTVLVVIMEGGSVRARIESVDRLGVVRPSNRLLPLSEIRFETPAGSLAGALVFTEPGEFVGVLNATLSRRDQVVPVQTFGADATSGALKAFAAPLQSRGFIGPADLTVAYTPGVDVVRKVLDGFISPSHEVEHPTLGVFCRDGVRGALITSVQAASPAETAGLKANDLIIGIGNFLIRNQLDFAKVMLRQRPGDHVPIRIERGGRAMMRTAVIGQLTD